GVSFTINRAELFGFIGPDGAGKTTLFRILTTVMMPDRGRARVLGKDVVTDLWALRPKIGYMPGRFSLYPDLTVAENLRFFASVFGTTIERERAQIAPIYDQLAPFADRRARRVARRVLGSARAIEVGGHDDCGVDAVHGRSEPLRSRGADAARQAARDRHAGERGRVVRSAAVRDRRWPRSCARRVPLSRAARAAPVRAYTLGLSVRRHAALCRQAERSAGRARRERAARIAYVA